MDTKLVKQLNAQLTYERFSADVYYSLAAQLDFLNLTGFAHYMKKRADEERVHADKFVEYLADRDVLPVIDKLDKPSVDLEDSDSMTAGERAFDAALAHEKTVTTRIWELYKMATELGDFATVVFLHWFITEQVEEEHTLDVILTKFELARDDGSAILLLNEELGE